MATYSNSACAAAADSVVDLVDGGTSAAHGHLVIRNSLNEVLATVSLSNPAFGSATVASPAVATAADLPIGFTGSAAGTAHNYVVQNRDGTTVWAGRCGLSGSGFSCILDNLAIGVGQAGNVTAFTHTQPNGTSEV